MRPVNKIPDSELVAQQKTSFLFTFLTYFQGHKLTVQVLHLSFQSTLCIAHVQPNYHGNVKPSRKRLRGCNRSDHFVIKQKIEGRRRTPPWWPAGYVAVVTASSFVDGEWNLWFWSINYSEKMRGIKDGERDVKVSDLESGLQWL